jgi:hypothetical protein
MLERVQISLQRLAEDLNVIPLSSHVWLTHPQMSPLLICKATSALDPQGYFITITETDQTSLSLLELVSAVSPASFEKMWTSVLFTDIKVHCLHPHCLYYNEYVIEKLWASLVVCRHPAREIHHLKMEEHIICLDAVCPT